MNKTLTAATVAALLLASPAFSFSTNANENAAAGQAKALANCVAVITNPDGPVGSDNSGTNSKDPKTLGTHVTNCDKFWTAIGAIGPD